LIRLEDVSFFYDDFKVLDSVSFDIKDKERVLLLGNNGSGKSTILKVLAGLIFPKVGRYFFKGKKITKKYLKTDAKEFRKELAILFQNPDTMLFNQTVLEEIKFSPQEFGMDVDIDKIAKIFKIEHLLDRSPLKLSGGEKQKVAFASIFATSPKVLLLDEPTANLDPKSTGWLVDFLYELDITTIISTHNLSLAYELGNRAIVLDDSHKVVYDGKIEELFKNKELLLKANLVHRHKHKLKFKERSHFHIHNWN
jgi:cobalt/nickel transport system ATP-binding protein